MLGLAATVYAYIWFLCQIDNTQNIGFYAKTWIIFGTVCPINKRDKR